MSKVYLLEVLKHGVHYKSMKQYTAKIGEWLIERGICFHEWSYTQYFHNIIVKYDYHYKGFMPWSCKKVRN